MIMMTRAHMQHLCTVCQVHPSLVVNMDQTGLNLVPSADWTYDEKGTTSVSSIGAEDK
jgi:hypothetical protein